MFAKEQRQRAQLEREAKERAAKVSDGIVVEHNVWVAQYDNTTTPQYDYTTTPTPTPALLPGPIFDPSSVYMPADPSVLARLEALERSIAATPTKQELETWAYKIIKAVRDAAGIAPWTEAEEEE